MELEEEEYESLLENKTQDLVELLEGKQHIGRKWLYKPKLEADGIIDKYTTRLVTKTHS